MPTCTRSTSRRRRGLTLVELIIGMAVSVITLGALATFLLAITAGWKQSGETFRVRNAATIADRQLQNLLGDVLTVAQTRAGGPAGTQAYLFYWKADNHNGIADGKAQFGEMALLEYEPATKTVWLYQAKANASMTAAQKVTAASETWGDPTAPAIVTYFKSSDILDARRVVVGGYAGNVANGVGVAATTFGYTTPSYGKPIARFDLTLSSTNAAARSYGSSALRTAQTPSNF